MWIKPMGFFNRYLPQGYLVGEGFLFYPFSLLIGSVVCQIERRIREELRAIHVHHYFNSLGGGI
jgi:hypothetical protein